MVLKCPQCSRQFKTAAALAQHKRDSHTSAAQTTGSRSQPSRPRRTPAPAAADARLVSGIDVIATVTVKAGVKAGTVLWQRALAPAALPGTRLGAESALWTRWRPRSLKVSISTSAGLNAFGLVGMGWTGDAEITFPSHSVQNISRLGAMRPSLIAAIAGPMNMAVPAQPARQWYDVEHGPAEDTSHGTLVVMAMGDVGGFQGSSTMIVRLHWTVEFSAPDLNLDVSAAGGATITPDAEWGGIKLFTTSDSSFDSAVLTVKAHHGGSAVTYSAARMGVVYKLKTAGTLQWTNGAGVSADVPYASRAVGYSEPILVFHSTKADAEAYQTTGDTAKCLQYVTQGPIGAADVAFTSEGVTGAPAGKSDPVLVRVRRLENRVELLLERLDAFLQAAEPEMLSRATTPSEHPGEE